VLLRRKRDGYRDEGEMMTTLDDLLLLPGESLAGVHVNSLVEQRVQEGFTLEYKQQLGDGDGVLKEIAAMANTFGGVIVVGVREDRSKGPAWGYPGNVVGVDPTCRDRLASFCSSRLTPPYDPEIVAVDVGDDRVVLIVRVDTDVAPRPLMFNGSVVVRTESGTRPADIFRLRDLFRETSDLTSGVLTALGRDPINHLGWNDDPRTDFFARLSFGVPVVGRGGRLRITDDARAALRNALCNSALDKWLGQLLGRAEGKNLSQWIPSGLTTSFHAESLWVGFIGTTRGFPEAQCLIEVPSVPVTAATLRCRLDVILRLTLAGFLAPSGLPGFKLSTADLLALPLAMLRTGARSIAPFASLLSGAPAGSAGPFHFEVLTYDRGLDVAVDTGKLQLVPGQTAGMGAHLISDTSLRTASDDALEHQAREWTRLLLQDCHYLGVDAHVDSLAVPQYS
jgi:hypothetical protein